MRNEQLQKLLIYKNLKHTMRRLIVWADIIIFNLFLVYWELIYLKQTNISWFCKCWHCAIMACVKIKWMADYFNMVCNANKVNLFPYNHILYFSSIS